MLDQNVITALFPIASDWLRIVRQNKRPDWDEDIRPLDVAHAREKAASIGMDPREYARTRGVDSRLLDGVNGEFRAAYFMAAKALGVPTSETLSLLKSFYETDLEQEIALWHKEASFNNIPLADFLSQRGISEEEQHHGRIIITAVLHKLNGLR